MRCRTTLERLENPRRNLYVQYCPSFPAASGLPGVSWSLQTKSIKPSNSPSANCNPCRFSRLSPQMSMSSHNILLSLSLCAVRILLPRAVLGVLHEGDQTLCSLLNIIRTGLHIFDCRSLQDKVEVVRKCPLWPMRLGVGELIPSGLIC